MGSSSVEDRTVTTTDKTELLHFVVGIREVRIHYIHERNYDSIQGRIAILHRKKEELGKHHQKDNFLQSPITKRQR